MRCGEFRAVGIFGGRPVVSSFAVGFGGGAKERRCCVGSVMIDDDVEVILTAASTEWIHASS